MKDAFVHIVIVVVIVVVMIAGWQAKRWLNWKVSYGPLVEQRMEQLEHRIEALENVSPSHLPD